MKHFVYTLLYLVLRKEVFCEKGVLRIEILQNSREKTCDKVSFLINLS